MLINCSECGKEKEEKKPYITRREHYPAEVVNHGICKECLKLIKKKRRKNG